MTAGMPILLCQPANAQKISGDFSRSVTQIHSKVYSAGESAIETI
jgi:hypothetical protein